MSFNKKTIAWSAGLALLLAGGLYFLSPWSTASASGLPTVTVYKSAACTCCTGWVEHMEEAGFHVETVEDQNLTLVKHDNGVPESLFSCHTATVDGYTVEGHVPAEDVKQLLTQRPEIRGIGVAGMPAGSPGMPGVPEGYTVASFTAEGASSVYARH